MTHSGRPALRQELRLRDLVFFSFIGVCGFRNIAMGAQTGPGAITNWLLGIAFFFIPVAFAVGRLSSLFPQQGGLYVWTRHYFGPWHGYLCFWVYWLGLAVLFPVMLMTFASISVYALGPRFIAYADHRGFIFAFSMLLLVLVIGSNLLGLRFGKWLDNLGAAALLALIVALAATAAAVWMKQGSATAFQLWPEWNWTRVSFLAQIGFALTGLEMSAILGGEIVEPRKNLPQAAALAAPMIAAVFVTGTAALQVVLPDGAISPMHGVTQAAAASVAFTGWHWIAPVTALLMLGAATGQLSVIGITASRLPYALGADNLLPRALARIHPRWGTPYVSILTVGAIAAAFLVLCNAGETLRSGYQTVVDLMVITGLLPFVYIFAAAWKSGARWSAALGMATTLFMLVCTIVPTADVQDVLRYEFKVWGCTLAILASGRLLYLRYSKTTPA
ncbi:MAG: APC family permease [Candidatus Solibacter usitatus]|nr:APC family permease [Candidatus Solibacter usitatus]